MPRFDDVDDLLRKLRDPTTSALYRSQADRLLHDIAHVDEETASEEIMTPIHAEATPDLPFLTTATESAPWRMWLESRLAGNPLRMLFRFDPDFLLGLQGPTLAAVAYRAGENPDTDIEQGQPLLAQTVEIDAEEYFVEVYAMRRPETPDELHLHLMLAGQRALPENVEVRLTWASEVRTARLDPDGAADLGVVSLASVRDTLAGEGAIFEIACTIG